MLKNVHRIRIICADNFVQNFKKVSEEFYYADLGSKFKFLFQIISTPAEFVENKIGCTIVVP